MIAATKLRPFVKWVGGKQALSGQLVNMFPRDFRTYYEPFVGGGSILLGLQPNDAIICDENDWLIDTYRAIRANCKQVVDLLEQLPNTKIEYLRIRSIDPESLNLCARAAHLIYLNKTCFRGLFRVNRKGRFNVPYGAYDRRYFDRDSLLAISDFLSDIEIRNGDFEIGVKGVSSKDFVYFDPPYYKLGGYSDFNRYTKSKFFESDHARLAKVCRTLDKGGIRWAVSNSDTSFIRDLFKGYGFRSIMNRREINLDSQQREISELLIHNY